MVTQNRWIIFILVVTIIFLTSTAYGQNTKNEKIAASDSTENQAVDKDGSQKDSKEESKANIGLFPIDDMHEVIQKERIAALQEIDIQRKATLKYFTSERQAIAKEIENELIRITDFMQSERRTILVEIESIGNRITENGILKSKKLIDHFFIRAFQFLLLIIFSTSILGFIIFRIVIKKG